MISRFPYRIEYGADARSVDDVVQVLVAQKRLIESGVAVMSATLKDIDILESKILVVKIEKGSLLTELVIELVSSYQHDLQNLIIPAIEEIFNEEIPEKYKSTITIFTILVVFFIARYSYNLIRGKKKDRPESVHIEGSYNTTINIISDRFGVKKDEVMKAIHDGVPPTERRSLIKAVTQFFSPARREPGTKIDLDGYGRIPSKVVDEYPSAADLADFDDTRNLDVPNAILDIRAIDRDRTKQGWAAVILDDPRFPKRLPMDLYPTVDADTLAQHAQVSGDLMVEGETLPNGKFNPKRIHLLSFKTRKQ